MEIDLSGSDVYICWSLVAENTINPSLLRRDSVILKFETAVGQEEMVIKLGLKI